MRTEPSFSAEPEYMQSDGVDNSQADLSFSLEHSAESQLLSDYRQRYGLSTDPFADDPHFPLYTGALRREILDQLLHLSQFSNNLLVVLGEYGVGKTRMAQAFIDSLDDADDICFLEGQITSNFGALFASIIEQFELSSAQEFTEFTASQSENDGLAVLIVDNAHHLTDAVLIELIGLIQSGAESRVHLVLFAEPHLLPRLEHFEMPDVVLSDFLLEKFSLTESVDYLNFRMEMADYLGPEIFNEQQAETWWRQSRGQLLRLHECAQDKLLMSVSTPQTFNSYKKSAPVFYILGASVVGAALLMGYMYLGRPVDTQLMQSSESIPSSKASQLSISLPASVSQEPVLLREGTNSIQMPPVDLSAKNINNELVSPAEPAVTTTNVANQNTAMPVQEKISALPLEKLAVISVAPVKATQKNVQPNLHKPNTVYVAKEPKKVEIAQAEKTAIAKMYKPRSEEIKNTSNSGSYSEQEKTILSWNKSEFTLQVVGLSSEQAARDYIAEQSNKKDLLMFKSTRQGKDWFAVITGRYPSSDKASQAAQLLPALQKKAIPWPRDMKTIQKEIRQY